jgi:hypothetical protein
VVRQESAKLLSPVRFRVTPLFFLPQIKLHDPYIMTEKEIIKQTAKMVKEKFLGEGSGHDWWHIYRVWCNSKSIGKTEKGVTCLLLN